MTSTSFVVVIFFAVQLALSLKVIVIGAGVSGLATAKRLKENGINVTVLEGRSRIGGRLHTIRDWGYPLELGAEWIHGIQGNPIYNLAKAAQVKMTPTNYDNFLIYDYNGSPLSLNYTFTEKTRFTDIVAQVAKIADSASHDAPLSQWLQQEKAKQSWTAQEDRMFVYNLVNEIELNYAADDSWMSGKYWDYDEEEYGGDVCFPNGYDWLIQTLAQGLDIRLNQTVDEVGTDYVTTNGGQGYFKADAIVVTVSLGVLKSEKIVFDPPLPEAKISSIKKMGMGLMNKIILEFPSSFSFLQTSNVDFLYYVANQNKTEFCEMFNWAKVTGENVLVLFTSGQFAIDMEKLTDKEVVVKALNTLRTMVPNFPDPSRYAVTRWGQDTYSLGSYSYIAYNATPNDARNIGKTVNKIWYFAGEHTVTDYPSTIHGAYLSGLREAQKIIQLFVHGQDPDSNYCEAPLLFKNHRSRRGHIRKYAPQLLQQQAETCINKN